MQRQYTTHVWLKQPGFWALELKPIAKPALPAVVRQRKEKPAPIPPSLQQFIRSQGGIDPDYADGMRAGEIRMVRDSGRQGLMPGVFSSRATKTLEEMTEACWTAGYIPEPDIDLMLYALSKDVEATLTGERRNRVYGHTGLDYATALDLERWESLLPQEEAAA